MVGHHCFASVHDSCLRMSLASDYKVAKDKLSSDILLSTFVDLSCVDDEVTKDFLAQCKTEHASLKQALKDLFASMLKSWLSFSQTEANGYVNRGEMFVLSPNQLHHLCKGRFKLEASRTNRRLLDVGAGDGSITARFVATETPSSKGNTEAFSEVVCTETAKYMRTRLAKRGFTVLLPAELADLSKKNSPQLDEQQAEKQQFDVIFCFNVLDRCSKPISLLQQLHSLLKTNQERQTEPSDAGDTDIESILVLAVVFPWCPFVELDHQQCRPEQELSLMEGYSCKNGASFEQSLERLVLNYILPAGFTLLSWTKVPYISKGDWNRPYYTLPDAVMVLSRAK